MRKTLTLAIGSVLAVSCGGGGGSALVVKPQSNYRANFPGDSWTYSVDFNFNQFGDYKGTLTESLTSDTYNGSPSIRFTRTFVLTTSNGPDTITGYEEVASDGTLLAQTVNGTLVAVTGNTFISPSVLTASTSASGVISLANGDTITEALNVVGAVQVQVPAGSYACWVIDQSADDAQNGKDHFQLWVPPEVGNYVQITDTTDNSDGTSYTYTAKLTSKVIVSGNTAGLRKALERINPFRGFHFSPLTRN